MGNEKAHHKGKHEILILISGKRIISGSGANTGYTVRFDS